MLMINKSIMKSIKLSSYSKNNNPNLGAMLLVLEIILAIIIAIIVKSISSLSSIYIILLSRFLFSVPLLLGFGFFQRGKNLFKINQKRTLLARIITGLLSLSFWFLALKHLNISIATVLFQVMSIFITLLAPIILKEYFGIRRFFAILLGFFGVIIINFNIDLDYSTFSLGLIYGLAGPFFGALMFLYLRKLGNNDEPISSAIWHNLTGAIVFFIIFLFLQPNFYFDFHIYILLALIGIISSFQQYLMAASHKYATASYLAPFHYFSIPLGFLSGIIFFKEEITFNLIIGTIVILCSTYYIFRRERSLKGRSK